jgi:hypothetical protein
MAASDSPIIVGRIIIPRRIIAANIENPVVANPSPLNTSRISGTITIIPKNPYTTDGIPAISSTAGLIKR